MFFRKSFSIDTSCGLPFIVLPAEPDWRVNGCHRQFGDPDKGFSGRLYPLEAGCGHNTFVLEIAPCYCDDIVVAVISEHQIEALVDLLDECKEVIHRYHCDALLED